MEGNVRHWIAGTSLLLWLSGTAWGQTAADKAAADTLFNEGKRLITAGEIETACGKFEASLARFPQLGAQLALASCYEKLGRTASAWGEFRAAASTARRASDEQRQRFAEERAATLESRLSRLVIKVESGYRIDGLEVKRDGAALPPAELDLPVPVDPGDHVVEASAPGWVAWSTKVSVAAVPGVVEVIVPALGKAPIRMEPVEPAPATAEAARPAAPAKIEEPGRQIAIAAAVHDEGLGRRRLAYAIGGGGVVLVSTSLMFGAVASRRWSDARSHCGDDGCDQAGHDLAGDARSMANLSTATFLVGTAALTTGVVLLLTGSRAGTLSVSGVGVGPAPLGLSMQGGF